MCTNHLQRWLRSWMAGPNLLWLVVLSDVLRRGDDSIHVEGWVNYAASFNFTLSKKTRRRKLRWNRFYFWQTTTRCHLSQQRDLYGDCECPHPRPSFLTNLDMLSLKSLATSVVDLPKTYN
ncbi:hypothetical protein IW261DRAFT_1125338 [Armillaria novae-zelandiae]|uniref:Secreted protein n=1 Tax=Armillaria novae-zelandiae TaxID=153914 RepID=A0AA39TCT3_9AGAR|nr:hypothetical protein IW261DRAFT_1125338 [Armillaria novae-zelandiae]